MKLSALYVVRNEEDILEQSLDLTHPYVDEIILVDMQSTDRTAEIARKFSKVKYFEYPYSEPLNMGDARTFSLQQATGDWFLQCDADELYPKESMEKIREFVENPGDAISCRVKYFNVAWRKGYVEPIEHYPDRLYKREVVEKYHGVLPLDMTIVKPEFRQVKCKGKGIEGVLEYDNPDDTSFEHPHQPIRQDIIFYHMARARGYNFELNKRLKYEKFTHPDKEDAENERNARWNQWVNGLYPMEEHSFPEIIPKRILPNPKVSVIIPCYNYELYVGQAIESCLNQTHKPHEIIVVDDASTDTSVEVIKKYDVTLLQQDTNRDVSEARNRGIEASTGDFFICLDADDMLHPEYIEKTLKVMQEEDCEVVFTDMKMIGDIDVPHHQYPDFNPADLLKAQTIPSTCALVDRRCYDPYGGFDPEANYEDWDFWTNLAIQKKYRFKQIKEPLFIYRRKQGSRIARLDERQEFGRQQIKERYEHQL